MRSTVATRQAQSKAIVIPSSDAAAASVDEGNDEPPTEAPGTIEASVPVASMFGTQLEPILRKELDGRLSSVSWFRTDWQRGGALTGFATYRDETDTEQDVVVKLPVPPRERRWLKRCHEHPDRHPDAACTPHLYAHGDALNGYDLAWVVIEKLPYGPVHPNPAPKGWGDAAFDLLLDAAADFHHAAQDVPTGNTTAATAAPSNDWSALFARAREQVKAKSFPNGQSWKKALKKHAKAFAALITQWDQRPVTGWCHGDLHPGNAMSRSPQASENGHAQAVLIDFACVRPGHWVEDAVYCEQLYWGHAAALHGHKPASQLAKGRKARGLPVDDDWSLWADRLRTLYALTAPATAGHHGGGAAYLDAALARLA